MYSSHSPNTLIKAHSKLFSNRESYFNELKTEVHSQMDTIKQKDESRNMNLAIDTGVTTTISEADKVKEKIKSGNSVFGKFSMHSLEEQLGHTTNLHLDP